MTDSTAPAPYRVLARKYRPGGFDALIGQEAMVRTLSNAIRTGRLAHAYVLTGVRGVGKTTTARILARAFNCIGPDGSGGPTPQPCGTCEHCIAIADDRHVDVIEMDAASRTGVDDIRELIEGVRYRPVSARFKIYIIDEVHMLSKNAFNALLKTLEEPPEHVKFIFATTEIRKLPVTVLSRCQRFDLRRVEESTLAAHFAAIAGREGVAITAPAVRLIARAAQGSVRDGLSLLDQAIAHTGGEIDEPGVRDMLGLADHGQIMALFEAVMAGDAAGALDGLAQLYAAGADPLVVLQDLLEIVHFLTKAKVAPEAAAAAAASQAEADRAAELAGRLAMPVLTRAWQMLLKGVAEVAAAPADYAAAEMVLVRLAYAATLPSPADLVRALDGGGSRQGSAGGPAADSAGGTPGVSPGVSPSATISAAPRDAGGQPQTQPQPALSASEVRTVLAFHPRSQTDPEEVLSERGVVDPPVVPASFADLLVLVDARREARLHTHLVNDVHLVRFETGRIEIRPEPAAPPDLAYRLGERLTAWTGRRWVVSVSNAEGEPTVRQQTDAAAAARRSAALDDPLVRAALAVFPGATIEEVREVRGEAPEPPHPEAGDEPPAELEEPS